MNYTEPTKNTNAPMPPEPKSNATTVPADVQVARMAGQLAWCMADSSPIKQPLLDFGLDPKSAQAAIAALSTTPNQTAIAQLHEPRYLFSFLSRSQLHSHVGHYIKTSTQPNPASSDHKNHVNISVMRNTTTNQVEIIIKPQGERKENTSYFEGTSKRATKSVKLTLNPDGLLTVSPVMAIKANSDVDAKSVSNELQANDLSTASCLFVSGDGKRENSVRHYQANKGVTVAELIQDKQNQDQQKTVQMALRYMDQVGSQLNALHEKGAAHFDCKPQNILYEKNSGQFTVIDIPEQKYDPCIEDPQGRYPLPVTPGFTTLPIRTKDMDSCYKEIDNIFHPPGTENISDCASTVTHLGHVNDSYAYLRGLYQIADSIPDGFFGAPAEKTALKDFVLDQMRVLNGQVIAYKQAKQANSKLNRWPDSNMTVAKVKEAFNDFCLNPKNSLQSAFETSQQPAATTTAHDGAVTAPLTVDAVLKESKNNSLLIRPWVHLLRKILPDSATKQALSSEVTLSQYSTTQSQNAGWQVVADAKSIQDPGFQEERLRLARVLVVAQVTQNLQESPGVNVEDCVTQVMNQRLDQSPSGNTTASLVDDFSTKLRASQGSIAQTVTSIQQSLPKPGKPAPPELLQEAKLIPLLQSHPAERKNL